MLTDHQPVTNFKNFTNSQYPMILVQKSSSSSLDGSTENQSLTIYFVGDFFVARFVAREKPKSTHRNPSSKLFQHS